MVLYSTTHPSRAACSSATVANVRSWGVKDCARIVLCSRSTFPVVAGEYGAVSRCLMPLLVRIRSNITGPGPGPNRAVNTLPLPVRIWAGTPCRASASLSAWHTGRAVARTTSRSFPLITLIAGCRGLRGCPGGAVAGQLTVIVVCASALLAPTAISL